ncbi:MAG: glutamate--tRNA ligase [Staphylothermus sp.]|nr:glutamate--tRNA ligase [Staphylothermus sp.]
MTLEKSLLEKVKKTAYKHALLNAYKHGGKAELKPVIAKIIGEIPEIRKNVREIIDLVKQVIEEVNKLSLEQQRKILEKEYPELLEEKREEKEKTLPPLPNAILGKVITRFAPNPDYTIHLGNARPALLSYWYAEMYNGKMILRFEDTDPRTKASFPEAYEKIKEDLSWLGIKWSEEYIQSLRLPIFYEILRRLIEKGGAYIDKCPSKEFKKYRDSGKPCPHREQPIDKQLEEYDKILEGYYGEGEAVIRIKTDLNHPDPSVRDWVAARIIDTSKTPHPIVGDRYILWPTYNLAAAVDDHLMGVTHILRAKEHVSNTIKQKYLYDHMGWKYPETIHFGRLSLEGVILSKSKMRKMILEYNMTPYDDPRFGTISGLRRRGIVREALHKIIRDVGIKPIDAHISFVNLAAINRSLIDKYARRYMAVDNPVYLKLSGFKNSLEAHIMRHPDTKETYRYLIKPNDIVMISGKDFKIIENKMFRLLGLGNFALSSIFVSNTIIGFEARLISTSPEDARKNNAPIIQWVKMNEHIIAELIIPEDLELKRKILYVEKNIVEEKIDNIVQFYRIGFARIDSIEENIVKCIYTHN